MNRILAAAALALAALAAPAHSLAQGPAAPAARPPLSTAEAEVAAAIDRLFDGMRAGDSAQVRAAFHPAARLQSVGVREGAPVLMTDSVGAFVAAVGRPHDQVWDERIEGLEVKVDGNFATAWMRYAFYLGERMTHCGVNALHLFRGADGAWKITQITDTRRREGCAPIPAQR